MSMIPKWIFKIINRKHLHGRKIIKIKGYRTALLEDKYGQRITSEFIWWIFMTRIEKRWARISNEKNN